MCLSSVHLHRIVIHSGYLPSSLLQIVMISMLHVVVDDANCAVIVVMTALLLCHCLVFKWHVLSHS